MLFDFDFNNFDNKDKLYSLYDGYIRGNMFENLYEPYKNYKVYDINPSNKKEELLYLLMMLEFAINDLNLYLIMHSDNKEVFDKYKEYIELYKKTKNEYETNFDILCLENEKEKYTYLDSKLPWEVNHV